MARSCYFTTAVILALVTFLACALAFVTPFWLVSWEQKQSTFSRIGLWEVCFTAFADPKQHAYRYYSGCWWIFHTELDDVREMLNPAWFISVQAFSVLALLSSIITLIAFVSGICTDSKSGCTLAGVVFSLLTAIFTFLSVVIFGACAKDPRLYRLPMPQYNYFSAGFALMILSFLSSMFGTAFSIAASHEGDDHDEHRDEK